jgi:hypothetical protein
VRTLNEGVKKAEVDVGSRPGLPSKVAEQMKAPERENRDFRQAMRYCAKRLFISLWRSSTAQAMISLIDEHRSVFGVEPICRLLPVAPST